MGENEVVLLRQEFKSYKEVTDKTISELSDIIHDHEKRIQQIERSKEKTDFQYEQIMKTLETLNKDTIPKLTKEIEELKNKPVKRYDQVITGLISAIIGGIVGFVVNKIFK